MNKYEGTLFEEFAIAMYGKSFNELDVFERLEVNLAAIRIECNGSTVEEEKRRISE